MATVLGLAMKISADASGFKLDPVQRALVGLGDQADKLTGQFDKFVGTSDAAARAQEQLAKQSQELINALRDGGSATAFAANFERLAQAAREQAAVFERGAEVTRQYTSVEEVRARKLAELDKLVQAGAISEQTYAAAVADVSGATAAAAEAERQRLAETAEAEKKRQAILADGAAFAAQYATEDEKRVASLARISDLLEAGAISEEIASRAREEASGAAAAAAEAEQARQATLAEGQRLTQQFATAEEKRTAELERIARLLDAGAISEETAARARDQASGANEAAAKAEKERADALAAASRIIQANLTPQERYDEQVQELRGHLDAGRLSQDQFNRAVAKAQQDLDKAGAAASKTDKNVESLAKNVRLLSAIEVGRLIVDGVQAIGNVMSGVTNQITSLVASVNSSLDTLNDFSARTGIGVEALQGYSLAAKLAGVDTEAFGTAVQKLAVNIGKATPGGELDKSLKGIGLSVAELRALAPEQQFAAIGDAISELPTAADRAAAAVAVFGKQGAALAPLFREGAASIEELKARAERLGVIVSETQIGNVADMNDNFDLVRATIEGIIGQVVGNLAPAVTAVTEEFLKFVEEWSGAQGQGGTGIANAITDTLLKGAEFFAGIFDTFVQNFESISSVLATVGDVFKIGGQLLFSGAEGFRTIFNLVQVGIDALLIGLGKVLEGIGSWVSSDLEQFGAGLAAASEESAKKNSREMEAAAANAANTVANVFTGAGNSAEEQGQGAGARFVKGVSDRVKQERAPQFQVETNIEKTRERFDNFFNGIVDQQSAVTGAMREYEAAVSSVADPMRMTAEEMQRIKDAQEKVNVLLDQEGQKRAEAADAARAQAEADEKIVATLLKTADASDEIEQKLAAVARERARMASQSGDDAQARVAQLDKARAQLEEQQQALDQGFGKSFEQAFEGANKAVDTAIDKSKEFGQTGFDAAQQLSQGIANAQQQVKDGILNKDAYEVEVKRQQELFDQRIANEKKVIDERKKAEDEAAKLRLQQEELVNQLIAQQAVGGDDARVKAAENLVAIEAEIARAQEAARAAREEGDQEAVKAAAQRLAQLDQVQAKERDIASGVAKQREEYQKAAVKQQEEAAKQQQQQQEAAQQEQARIAEEIRKAQEAEFNRQQERLGKLNTLGEQAVQTSDVRTAEGAALVLSLAANAQDPALIEQRLQTKLLQRIAEGTAAAAANYFNTPVAIVGYSQLG